MILLTKSLLKCSEGSYDPLMPSTATYSSNSGTWIVEPNGNCASRYPAVLVSGKQSNQALDGFEHDRVIHPDARFH